jgi:hypothetical protein
MKLTTALVSALNLPPAGSWCVDDAPVTHQVESSNATNGPPLLPYVMSTNAEMICPSDPASVCVGARALDECVVSLLPITQSRNIHA